MEEGGSMKGYLVAERFMVCCACVLGCGGLGARLVVVDLAIGLWVSLYTFKSHLAMWVSYKFL